MFVSRKGTASVPTSGSEASEGTLPADRQPAQASAVSE
jgi:hypothetical protein